MNKSLFAARLRVLSDLDFFGEGQSLFNAFSGYFADWLENSWSKEEVTVSNYLELIDLVIARLRQEKMDDHPADENLRLLIHTIKGVNSLEQQIKDYFTLEKVVKFLAISGFYQELAGLLAESR